MATSELLKRLELQVNQQRKPMPVLFVGHGSPMNGIDINEFSLNWVKMGQEIPTPSTVLCVSAHWLTRGTFVTAMEKPETIHDFGGFPNELFDVRYPAAGNPALARETVELVKETNVGLDHDWGLDHGTWTVVRRMYPDANIPVLQLSIDINQPAGFHYKLGSELAELRKKGVLIIGSGNMVHNLRMTAWDKLDQLGFGYDWALEINEVFKRNILSGNHEALIDYKGLGAAAMNAIPTPDHYYPLLYTLGLQSKSDEIEIFNDKAVGGSLTMTSVKIG
jgi:4,5-DOPA dioxygenase extradiol